LGAKVAVADLNLHSYEEFEAEAKDMTGDSTVAEIEASGGSALGIELDVTDHAAVNAMVARVVAAWAGSMSWWQMLMVAVVGPWMPKPAPSIRRSCSLSSG
jgi:NAD(P)-dependent dehydrogenase (short-subunit alcohol dehydrogenase family)